MSLLHLLRELGRFSSIGREAQPTAARPWLHSAWNERGRYVSNEQTVPGKRYISGETFHTDHSNHPAPPKATILFLVSLPSHGGDTQYVNMHAAYDDLSAATKQRIDGLKAVHVYLSKYSPRELRPLSEDSARPHSYCRLQHWRQIILPQTRANGLRKISCFIPAR